MYKYIFRMTVFACFVVAALLLLSFQAAAREKDPVNNRPSILAGTWYPGNAVTLKKAVQGYLSRAKAHPLHGTLKALIVPHAGHMYSGPVAAHAYRLLRGKNFKRIILVGPSHRMRFKGVSVNLQTGYETPLGIVPVDMEMARRIMDTGSHMSWIKKAHAVEHSLEIQLPFLQTVLNDFRIVPILMGRQDLGTCFSLADSLVRILGSSRDTLLLASTDLSHYHSYAQAKNLDRQFIGHVQRFDPQGLSSALISGACEACGSGPTITIMLAARKLGANRSVILNYANSGDVTGDHGRVVGYLSAALIKASGTGPRPE